MKRLLLVSIGLVVAVSCGKKTSIKPPTPPEFGYISGVVFYKTCGEINGIHGWVDAPYQGAIVISIKAGQPKDTSETDSLGHYRVQLEPGLYDLIVKTATTYPDSSLKNINLPPGQDTTVEDIHLGGLFAVGQLIVSFKPELTYEEIELILQQYGCFIIEKITSWPFDMYLVGIPEQSVVSDILPLLANDPGVALISPSAVRCPF